MKQGAGDTCTHLEFSFKIPFALSEVLAQGLVLFTFSMGLPFAFKPLCECPHRLPEAVS